MPSGRIKITIKKNRVRAGKKKQRFGNFASVTKSILIGLIAAGLFSSVLYVFANPPDSPYAPGYTLTPGCAPGSTNCTVVTPAVYSFGANNFSGSGDFVTSGAIQGGATTVSNLTDSGLTITRIPYASTAGLLVDSANLTFDGTTLTAGGFTTTGTGTFGIGKFTTGLHDGSDVLSIDPYNRILYASDGTTVMMDYSGTKSGVVDLRDNNLIAYTLNDNTANYNTAVYIAARQLLADDGSDAILDWHTVGIADFMDSAITTTGTVTGDNLTATFNLSAYGGAVYVNDVTAGVLHADSGFVTSIGRFTDGIYDSAGTPTYSIKTDERQLISGDGTNIVLDWSSDTLLNAGDSDFTTTGTGTFGKAIVGSGTASGTNSIAMGNVQTGGGTLTASGIGAMAVGYIHNTDIGGPSALTASGNGSIAMGYTDLYSSFISSGKGTVALGGSYATGTVQAIGFGSIAMGAAYDSGVLTAGAVGQTPGFGGSIAMGYTDATLTSSGYGSIAMGYANSSIGNLTATGNAAIAIGQSVNATQDVAIAMGSGFTNNTASSFMVGFGQADLQVASGAITFPNNATLNTGSGSITTTGTGTFGTLAVTKTLVPAESPTGPGETVYGLHNTLDTGTGYLTTDDNIYGVRNDITNNITAGDGGVGLVYGIYNNITVGGNGGPSTLSYGVKNVMTSTISDDSMYGVHNTLNVGQYAGFGYADYNLVTTTADAATGYGTYNDVVQNSAGSNYLYGGYFRLKPSSPADTAYGLYVTEQAGTIDDPVFNQIGLYVDWSYAGTDANNLKWAIYNASTNTTSGKVFLGIDNVKTYFGTGTDAAIYYDGTNLVIDPKVVGTGVVNLNGGGLTTTGTGTFGGLALGADAAGTFGIGRRTTTTYEGKNLTINAGGATSGQSNKNGGDLTLLGGIATGTGSSNIVFQTATAGTTGSTDRTPTTKWTIDGAGSLLSGTAGTSGYNFATWGTGTFGGTLILGVDATPNIAGILKLFSAGSNAFYTTFTTATQTANADYTLPTALATANSQALLGSTAGVLSWGTDFGANNITTTGAGRFDGGLGVGAAASSTVGLTATLAGMTTGLSFTNSAVSTGNSSYGANNTITASGDMTNGYGTFNTITASGGSSRAYGVENDITVSGGAIMGGSYGIGVNNTVTGDGSTARIYGVNNSVSSSGANNDQFLYGEATYISPNGTGVTAYGNHISTSAEITNPTVDQIGLYLSWETVGTDVNNKKWALYNASTDTTGGKVFLGIDNQKTYWGTGYDASVYFDGSALIIDPNLVTAGDTVKIGATANDTIAAGLYKTGATSGLASGTTCNDVTVAGGIVTAGTCTSDIRYKENVTTLDNVLEKINSIRAVSYNLNESYRFDNPSAKADKQIGMIAQEVEAQFPELVATNEEGYKSIRYTMFTGVLLEAVKELNQKIDTLGGGSVTLNQTGGVGTGAVSGVSSTSLSQSLIDLGMTLVDGVATLKDIVADKLTTKTAKMERLEMVDSATGEVWCTWIENGEWQKVKGDCADVSLATAGQVAPTPEVIPTPIVDITPTLETVIEPVVVEQINDIQENIDDLQNNINQLEQQNKNQEKQINNLKKVSDKVDDLQQNVEEIKEENKKQEAQLEEQLPAVQEEVSPSEESAIQQPGSILSSLKSVWELINPSKLVEPAKKAGSWILDLITIF